jgi:hypothetical protein
MPSINPGFDYRVKIAAAYITSGRKTTRAFDTCFENFDGDAVALSLYLRAQKRPDTLLAQNITRYISGKHLIDEHPDVRTLDELRRFALTFIPKKVA